ncbi:MAG: hypothetical protein NWF05_11615 [Candidatus Bathyarchaeota archaeon]|nr:hypothetical protein [Candidatus Bathyarchaeota archaeon]
MTIILLISLALPLFSLPFASAAANVEISPTSGPNGTAVKVTGSGFGASETSGAFTVTVDGLPTKALVTGGGLEAGAELATDASGNILKNRYIIIGGAGGLNLAPGVHTVQISDAVAAPVAVTFTIVAPTVTVTSTDSAGTSVLSSPAGTSVLVSASGFAKGVPRVYTVTNAVTAATFAGTAITVNAGTVTNNPSLLSSNVITNKGAYTGTVSLPAITTGSSFTLTDNYGNTATAAISLNTPVITLSPNSGPANTLVTVTATGFGPNTAFTSATAVKFGATAYSGATTLLPNSPTTTEQGTAVFMFGVGTSTVDFTAGAHTVTVTDDLGNKATATFTVTSAAKVTIGDAVTDSGISWAPTGATAKLYLSLTGFKANSPVTVTSLPGIPAAWINFGVLTTDANGELAASSTATAAAPAPGTYQVTVSDGTNTVSAILTITTSANFIYATPTSGAQGTTVQVFAYGTTPANVLFDGASPPGISPVAAATVWPAVPAATTFPVPTSIVAAHTITANGGVTYNTIIYQTTSGATISTVSPPSAAVGTKVTVVGSGFATPLAPTGLGVGTITIDGVTLTGITGTLINGMVIASFSMPAFTVGAHTISVSDSTGVPVNTATSTVSVTASSITVTPNSGNVNQAGLSITGSGFVAGEAITVKLDGVTIAPLAGVPATGLTVINTNGGILLYTGVSIVPAGSLVAGAHTITVTGVTGGIAVATFTIEPKITLTPSALRAGAVTVITATGFAGSTTASVTVNGTAANWFNTGTTANTTTIPTTALGDIPVAPVEGGLVIAPATAAGTLNITVTDTNGNSASKILTVLDTPAITLSATQTVAGVVVSISGSGFSPTGAARAATANLYSGTTLVQAIVLDAPSTVTPNSTGQFTDEATFTVPTLSSGEYILGLTVATPPETESANATFTILGTQTVTATASSIVGGNVTVNVVGLTGITNAILGATDLLAGTFGPTTVPTTGPDAYNLTTWFLAPALTAGPYTLLLSDGVRSTTTTVNIIASITLAPTVGILKGSVVTVTGTGFAVAGTVFTVSVNGVDMPAAAGLTGAGGAVVTAFTVPVTAGSNNSVVVTDAQGNTATSYFALTNPTIIVNPTVGAAGSTVQVIGSGFAAGQPVYFQVGSIIVPSTPATVTGTDFVAYITIPAGTPAGTTVISATDARNNVAVTEFTVGSGGSGFTVNQAALSSTAQTVNPSTGTAQTEFARGTSVKFSFVLETASGSGNVVWGITLQQQDLTVTGLFTTTASVSTTPSTLTYTNLLTSNVQPGTWTATIQIFGSDGVTPLAVTTLTFTVT